MIELPDGELVHYCGATANLGGGWRSGKWPEPDLRYCIRDQHPLCSLETWEKEIAWALAQWSKLFELNFERIDDPRPGKAHLLFTVGNLGGPGGVLAQAGLIPYGVRRNDDFQSVIQTDSFDKFGEEDRSVVAMQFKAGLVLCHEVGHSCGMMHDETRELALLDPQYNPTIAGPQKRDIVMMQALGYQLRTVAPTTPPDSTGGEGRLQTTQLRPGQVYTAKTHSVVVSQPS